MRRKRRHRRNPAGAFLGRPVEMVKAGFKTDAMKEAMGVIAGNIGTTFFANLATSKVGFLNNKVGKIVMPLVLAGAVSKLASKAMPSQARHVLIGGILAGLTKGLQALFPSYFGALADDLDDGLFGLDDWARPNQIAAAYPMNGFGDFATARQVSAAQAIDGMDEADMVVANEMASLA